MGGRFRRDRTAPVRNAQLSLNLMLYAAYKIRINILKFLTLL